MKKELKVRFDAQSRKQLVLSMVLFLCLLFHFFIKPFFLSYFELLEKKQNLMQLISNQEKKLYFLKNIKKKLDGLRTKPNLETERKDKGEEIFFMLQLLNQIGRNHQLFFEKLSPSQSEKSENGVMIEARISGSYSNLLLFLIEILEKEPFIYIFSFSFTSESSNNSKEEFPLDALHFNLVLKSKRFFEKRGTEIG